MVSDYSLATVVPPFVRMVAHEAPQMRLTIRPQQTFPGLQLERGETDLLIAPRVHASPDHPSQTLLSDPMVCVMDAANPAARGLTLEDFTRLEHVAMEPPVAGESHVARRLREAGVSVTVAVTSFSFISLPDLVRGTDRLALVQGRLARRIAREGGLAILDPPLPLAPLEQCIQWHSMRDTDAALVWLRRKLVQAAQSPQVAGSSH